MSTRVSSSCSSRNICSRLQSYHTHLRSQLVLQDPYNCRRFHSANEASALLPPTLIYQNNHVLAVCKPPGWHAVPNNHQQHDSLYENDKRTSTCSDDKCLLTYLQRQQLGGGSRKDYLSPVRRIDQPCTGLQLYAKTHRAASRIQSHWQDSKKTYLCVLEEARIQQNSGHNDGRLGNQCGSLKDPPLSTWSTLQGYLQPQRVRPSLSNKKASISSPPIGWNVQINPQRQNLRDKLVALQYQFLSDRLVLVQTDQGTRHMVRALWSQIAHRPIAGDTRYGACTTMPDHSVALHAYRLELSPASRIGTTPLTFEAPPPSTWYDYFDIPSNIFPEVQR